MAIGPNAVLLVLGEGQGRQNLWLEFNIDALCQLEELLDLDATRIVAKMARTNRLGFTRAILWGALQVHQVGYDLKAAGELFRLPGHEAIRPKLLEAFAKAFPAPGDEWAEEAGDEAARPPESAA
jgi:hypothetical protein